MFKLLICIGLVLFIWNYILKRSQKDKVTSVINSVKKSMKNKDNE